MFRTDYPVAWSFHRNTSRWPYNCLRPDANKQHTPPFKELLDAPVIELPPPLALNSPLGEAIIGRFSCRRFTAESLGIAELATLLHWSYGKLGIVYPNQSEMITRPVPSGGGLYPLELYVMAQRVEKLPPGIYHYNVLGHFLEQVHPGAMPDSLLSELFMRQPYVAEASAVLVLTAVFDRSMWKYEDRGYRYLLLEAGHVAQNFNLTVTSLGLASLNLGGFFDADLSDFLKLEPDEEAPLYAVAIGHPQSGHPDQLRLPERPLDT